VWLGVRQHNAWPAAELLEGGRAWPVAGQWLGEAGQRRQEQGAGCGVEGRVTDRFGQLELEVRQAGHRSGPLVRAASRAGSCLLLNPFDSPGDLQGKPREQSTQ